MIRHLLLALSLLIAACTSPSTGDSNTNWLMSCETDADCGEGPCLCGVCTETCDPGSCGGFGIAAQCVARSETRLQTSCKDEVDSVCLPECPAGTCGEGLYCVTGVCVAAPGECGCESCRSTLGRCGDAPGCREIASCADREGCVGMECYGIAPESGPCRVMISERGGLSGDAFQSYLGVATCDCGGAPVTPLIDVCR